MSRFSTISRCISETVRDRDLVTMCDYWEWSPTTLTMPIPAAASHSRKYCVSTTKHIFQILSLSGSCTILVFSVRQHICLARYMLQPVRPSICLSHGLISQKRLALG